jgi:phospholipid/cholesterol/gamma-HCH transport system substrate-binding protein
MTGFRRRGTVLAAGCAALLAVSGCSFKGAYSLPLPGGAATGKTYSVTAYFKDVQDLTPDSAVRVNDVAVGAVSGITLDTNRADIPKGYYLKARVRLKVKQSVKLPLNAVATLDQTTLLGEKFVSLAPPPNQAPVGQLVNGDTVQSATALPSVEEVFSLLSGVLNGGDLQDLQTINIQISKALAGRETAVRGALTQLTTFVTGLNGQKHQIVRALDELDRFTTQLKAQDGTIATALTQLGPGLRVLANEHQQFADLLTDLSNFGRVASRVINASSAQTITGLRDLEPILGHLSAAGSSLPRALEILLTYPFPRDSSQASPGDYTNFAFTLDVGPLLCSVFAGDTPAQLSSILGPVEGQLVSLLTGGTDKCQKTGTVSSPLTTPGIGTLNRPSTKADRQSTSDAAPSPTPSPTATGLSRLLNGLLGGGN